MSTDRPPHNLAVATLRMAAYEAARRFCEHVEGCDHCNARSPDNMDQKYLIYYIGCEVGAHLSKVSTEATTAESRAWMAAAAKTGTPPDEMRRTPQWGLTWEQEVPLGFLLALATPTEGATLDQIIANLRAAKDPPPILTQLEDWPLEAVITDMVLDLRDEGNIKAVNPAGELHRTVWRFLLPGEEAP